MLPAGSWEENLPHQEWDPALTVAGLAPCPWGQPDSRGVDALLTAGREPVLVRMASGHTAMVHSELERCHWQCEDKTSTGLSHAW